MPTPAELAQYVEQLGDDEWYEFLDALDGVSRRRRAREEPPDPPADTDPATVAEWVARGHFFVDPGIREICYLPHGAPEGHIRLVEVGDRIVERDAVVAMDFGVPFGDNGYRLSVADVTSDQWERILRGQLALPAGWSVENRTVWGRRR